MKNLHCFIVIMHMGLSLHAQITVNRDGNVGIGSKHAMYGLDVRVNNGIRFSSSGGEGITFRPDTLSCEEDFVFDHHLNKPILSANSSYYGYLGNDSIKLNEIRSHRIFADFFYVPADQDMAQNIRPIHGAFSRILSAMRQRSSAMYLELQK